MMASSVSVTSAWTQSFLLPIVLSKYGEDTICWKIVNKRKPHEMVKHTQTIRWQHPTNCLSVFDHFWGLAFKGLVYNDGAISILQFSLNFIDVSYQSY